MIDVKLHIHNGAVEEAPKEFEIVFNISGVTMSLWLESNMTNKEFIRTIINFLDRVIKVVMK